jgi:septum formation protein
MRIVLASASPRRKELLRALIDDFDIEPADVEELLGPDPRRDAVRLAAAKASVIAARHPNCLVIGSDTVVYDGNRSYGKPESPKDAVRMLRSLRGRSHTVITGVAVAWAGRVDSGETSANVRVADIGDRSIDAYVASGRPMDKAGAYAIQDEDVPTVATLEGCYCCVVGLPLWRLHGLLEANGVKCRTPDVTFARCAACPDREDTERSEKWQRQS